MVMSAPGQFVGYYLLTLRSTGMSLRGRSCSLSEAISSHVGDCFAAKPKSAARNDINFK
jgi:hypothetical protein